MLNDHIHIAIAILMVAFAAIGWSSVITQEGMVFGFIRRFKLPEWLKKPMYSCAYCVSGQMALWLFLSMNFQILFNLMFSAIAICAAVGLTYIIISRQ